MPRSGAIGALCGAKVYSSHLVEWRRLRQTDALEAHYPGSEAGSWPVTPWLRRTAS